MHTHLFPILHCPGGQTLQYRFGIENDVLSLIQLLLYLAQERRAFLVIEQQFTRLQRAGIFTCLIVAGICFRAEESTNAPRWEFAISAQTLLLCACARKVRRRRLKTPFMSPDKEKAGAQREGWDSCVETPSTANIVVD